MLDEEKDELSELVEGRIVNIFYLFSQAENYVKEVVADRVVLKRMLSHYPWCTLLTISRRLEEPKSHDTSTSDHDAQVHQEFVHVVDDVGQSAFSECH